MTENTPTFPATRATPGTSAADHEVAVVMLAHNNPAHVRRLVAALDPLPVFLHVDATVPDQMFHDLVDDLPSDRLTLVPRRPSGWGNPALLTAELDGYRLALQQTGARHIIMCTGADYPLVSVPALRRALASQPDASWVSFYRLPHAEWGRFQGYERFLVPTRAWRRRRVPLPPFVHLWPRTIMPAGGSQMRILSRQHAERVTSLLTPESRLLRYFMTCWTADETGIPSVLTSPRLSPDWPAAFVNQAPWFIDWGPNPGPSPRWLQLEDFEAIRRFRLREGRPGLMARKFSDDSAPLLDRIDAELRTLD